MPFVLIREGVIEAIHAEQTARHGHRTGLRARSPLSLMHARVSALNESAATDLASLAACYGYALSHEQPFHEASLATALIATELFLSLNGYQLTADDTACCLGFTVAGNGELGAEAFASWIRGHIAPQPATAA